MTNDDSAKEGARILTVIYQCPECVFTTEDITDFPLNRQRTEGADHRLCPECETVVWRPE